MFLLPSRYLVVVLMFYDRCKQERLQIKITEERLVKRKLKYKNGRYNKALVTGTVLFLIALAALVFNTLSAHLMNGGTPLVHPSIMIGPIVLNIPTIPVVIIAAVFFAKGIYNKKHDTQKSK